MALSDFTNQFVKALKALEGIKKTDHLSVRQNAFYKFYKEFGTHYFVESKFGSKLIIKTEFSKSEVSYMMQTLLIIRFYVLKRSQRLK